MTAKRVMFKMEFICRASPTILYQFLTTPACLVRWFCDEVDIYNEEYTFSWDGFEEKATLIEDWEDELLRFQWENAPVAAEFLEFKITKSPVTDETILIITDFAEPNDVAGARQLWETQIRQMQVETGG
jgi:uncharacterized protein YndB with AHSA1/START domain